MSCYEWESGTLKLPSKEVPKVRKALNEIVKQLTELTYKETLKSYEYMRMSARKKKKLGPLGPEIDYNLVIYIKEKDGKPVRPTKAEVKKFVCQVYENPNRPGKLISVQQGGVSISFRPKDRTISWDVAENNHACDYANESILGKWFHETMHAVNWTRGSGGTIIGNNEYNRDDHTVGGGGNYVVRTYGPKTKKAKKQVQYY